MNTLILLLSLGSVVAIDALSPAVYQRATRAYHQKQYTKATQDFRLILASLKAQEKNAKPGSRQRYFFVLGQCDVAYYMGQIAFQQGKMRRGCRQLQGMSRQLATVPKNWTTWAVQPHLLVHMRDGKSTFARTCHKVPTPLRIATTPKDAILSYRLTPQNDWSTLQGNAINLLQQQVYVRAQKAGYLNQEMLVTLRRWHPQTIALTLTKRRTPPSLAAKPQPQPQPQATPFYKTWWFWTITGVIVVGGTAAAIAIPLTEQTKITLKPTAW